MQNDYFNVDEEFDDVLRDLEIYVKDPSMYRKEELPNFEGPFTEAEKKAFINQYTITLNNLNFFLPDGMKLNPDIEGFKAKINDPKQAEIYRRTNYISEIKAKKKEILYKTYDELGINHKDNLPLSGTIDLLIRIDNTPEANKYNKNLLRYYHKYPNDVSQVVIKALLNADSTIYDSILKDDYERCKDYTDYFERSQLAFNSDYIINTIGENSKTNYLKNTQLVDLLKAQNNLSAGFTMLDFFAIPKISFEQYQELLINKNDIRIANIIDTITKDKDVYFTEKDGKEEIKLLKNAGILNDKDKTPALSFKAIETAEDGTKKEIKLIDALKDNNPNVKIEKRSEEEKANITYITEDLKERTTFRIFGIEFLNDYNNDKLKKFDRDKILDNNKGSFFERLFNTTSKEYKEFVANFKKFTDPKHPDISVKNKLIASANAYLRHKGVNEDYDVFNLDEGTGKERVRFCQAVLYAFRQVEDDGKPIVFDDELTTNEKTVVEGLEKDANIEKAPNKEVNNTIKNTKSIEANIDKNIVK